MNLLLIEITGKTIGATVGVAIILAVVFIMLSSLFEIRRRYKETPDEESYIPDEGESIIDIKNNKFIDFHIVNNSEEELTLELCKLDINDKRYTVNVSNGSYSMLVEYFKTNSFFVNVTRAFYDNKDVWKGFGISAWYKNIIYLKGYSPFSSYQRPVLVVCDDIDKCQYQSNIIEAKGGYSFDYFNDLEIKLLPKTNMRVLLFGSKPILTFPNEPIKYQPIQCAMSIVNKSNEKQTIELFNKKYFDEKLKDNIEVKLESLFSQVSYEEIIAQFEARPLIAKRFQFIVNSENHNSKLKINLKEYTLNELISVNQFQSNVIDLPFDAETYIHNTSIEIEPNTEILLSIK